MKIIPNGSINRSEISKIEQTLGFRFDEDYVQFLEHSNGCVFQGSGIEIKDIFQEVTVNMLFGINMESEVSNLEFWIKEYQDEIPAESILIGNDANNGLFLLLMNEGVYYWDHSWAYEQSNEEENTYFVASSFTEFMAKIKPMSS